MSVLDCKETHLFGFPLTVGQQVCLLYLVPTLVQLLVYILDLATDLGIGVALLREGHSLAGGATLAVTWGPPLALLAIRLSQPPDPPAALPVLRWLFTELLACLLYPLRPLFCLSERLFWSVEALVSEEPCREEALVEFEATRTHVFESYLFLQGFVQAGPQAILQAGLLVISLSQVPGTEEMQAFCMVCSLMSLSLVAANYHRYESQCQGGRQRVLGVATKPPSAPSSPDGPSPDPVRDAALGASVTLPLRSLWTKAMTSDVPAGKLLLFLFWLLFLLGRLLVLALAASSFPAIVVGVVAGHYLLFFLYILPSPKFTASLPAKLFLPFVFVFTLVEVGIQFSRPGILYTLFYLVSTGENIALAVVWALWGHHERVFWFHYCLYVVGASQVLALLLVSLYIKFYRPKVKRMRPRSQEVPEERPLNSHRVSTLIL